MSMQSRGLFRLFIAVVFLLPAATQAQEPITLEHAVVDERELSHGGFFDYMVRLAVGESADVVVHQLGVDVVVDVTAADGRLLDSIDSPTGRTGDEIVEIIAKEAGTYRLRVRPFDGQEPVGKFVLEVRALRTRGETEKLLQQRQHARDEAATWLRRHGQMLKGPIENLGHGERIGPIDVLARRSTVLAIGEATHGSREFGDVRLALTKYLVARHGYRVVAVEYSATKMRRLQDYVSGGQLENKEVKELIESGLWVGRRPLRQLVEWARAWNKHSQPEDRVVLVGVDAPENVLSRAVLRSFLEKAYDGDEFMKQWPTVEKEIADADEQTAVFGDSGFSAGTRNFLIDVVARLTLDRALLQARFGRAAVDEAQNAAAVLAQFADFNSGEANGKSRDWYMAVNILAARRSPSDRVLYWAHNSHVATVRGGRFPSTGAYLRQAIGCKYGAIALTFGEGAFVAQIPNDLEDRLAINTLPPAPEETIEGVARMAYPGAMVATWGCDGTGGVPEWLRIAHVMHWVGGLYSPSSLPSSALRPFDLLAQFDGIIFLPRVSAEEIPLNRPLIPARKR